LFLGRLSRPLRKILGVVGLGIHWGIVGALFFFLIVSAIGMFRPHDISPGADPLSAGWTGFLFGVTSGLLFGLLLTAIENRKFVAALNWKRVAIWGALACAVWPLLHALRIEMVLALCGGGGLYSIFSVLVAQHYERRQPKSSFLFKLVGRSLRDPLRATCAPSR
jgi:hypothetical protein